jgi:hypothetical protein
MISQELIDEAYEERPAKTFTKPTEAAPDGGYIMGVRGLYPRQTSTGTVQAKLLLVHTGENSELYKSSYFTLSKTRDGISNTPGTDRALLALARAFGLSKEEAGTINFASNGNEASIYFRTFDGQDSELVLGGELVWAKLATREYVGNDGVQKSYQEVTSIGVARTE